MPRTSPVRAFRNDTTQVAITSDPGKVMTYILRNGHGHQDVIEATVTFSQSVVVTGVPELILQMGESKRVATYRSGTGTSALVFRYMIAEGELDSDGVSVPAGAIQTSRGVVRYLSNQVHGSGPGGARCSVRSPGRRCPSSLAFRQRLGESKRADPDLGQGSGRGLDAHPAWCGVSGPRHQRKTRTAISVRFRSLARS